MTATNRTASTTADVTLVTCPGTICGKGAACGDRVEARGFNSPRAKTVRVAPCTTLLAQGWTGIQLAEFKARADYLRD